MSHELSHSESYSLQKLWMNDPHAHVCVHVLGVRWGRWAWKESVNVFDVCSPILKTICDDFGLGEGAAGEKSPTTTAHMGFHFKWRDHTSPPKCVCAFPVKIMHWPLVAKCLYTNILGPTVGWWSELPTSYNTNSKGQCGMYSSELWPQTLMEH